ncbi:hypothetical protein Goshw_019474 [Gossypium schwendimanii]|uniref:Disease resistance protein n=1 Tax=Gossypium schwendimanii TaxID=34291 RepID=A0A7J9MDC0_GOSSC|nr:hypothetical protein [Gossypium schwendimanii]
MQGDHIINSLLNACLLERAGEDYVKMHDVIREMALWIACELEVKENNFFVKAGAQLLEEPDAKTWEGAKRMSIMSNQMKVLRETPKCPNLRTLFLRENNLQVISDGFFHFMPHLTVLNLSRNYGLEELPKGISQLISLECLDLSSTGIRELPIELKSLTKLKMLDLSNMLFVGKMKIPRQLISSFSKLQIFKLRPLINRDYPDEEEDNVLNGVNENLIKELRVIAQN